MSVTEIPDPLVSEGSGLDRAAYIQGLLDLAHFYSTHPDVPLPGIDGLVHQEIPVPGAARGARLEALAVIAERMGVPVVKNRGVLYAERPFGPVKLRAAVKDADFISEVLRAAAERDAAEASGSAA